MIISLSWVKDFIDIPTKYDAHDIANSLTLSTAEVEEVKLTNDHLEKIITVKVVSLKKHPQAEKLNLVTFTDGKKEFEVVCGAPNVKPGIIVPFASIGVTLPNGLTLEAKNIRGVMSQGMLCSSKELGLGEDTAGLLILPETTPLGITIAKSLNINSDQLIDIDNKSLTHRPDLWGMWGMARELKTIYNLPWKKNFDSNWMKKIEGKFGNKKSDFFDIKTKSNECLSFFAISLTNLRVEKSPRWMIERLESCGIRAINNIVDITNYVMLEVGAPLHAYDAGKAQGKLAISTLTDSKSFILLDGKNVTLLPGDVVISDEKNIQVLAGIMGGASCGVSDSTKSIILEAAVWDSAKIRQTATRLGLRTDASSRFEKSLDSRISKTAFYRALELILEIIPSAKIEFAPHYWFAKPDLEFPKTIDLDPTYISKVLGKNIESSVIENYLKSLEFKVDKKSSNLWTLGIPSFRATKDISISEDIVEEIGRLVGYDSIPISSPLVSVTPVALSKKKFFERQLLSFLSTHSRCFEVMTYPLIGKEHLKRASWKDENELLTLVNSLSVDADRMRPSLVPTLLDCIALNSKTFSSFRIFEFGRSYAAPSFEKIKEHLDLAIVFSGETHQGKELVDTVESLFKFFKLPLDLKFCDSKDIESSRLMEAHWIGLHPFECVSLKSMGQNVGLIFTLHPQLLKKYKVKHFTHMALIDCDAISIRAFDSKSKYKPVSYLQDVNFDCCVIIKENDYSSNPIKIIEGLRSAEISSVKIIDIYSSGSSQKSVTIRCTFTPTIAPFEPSKIKELEVLVVSTLEKSGYNLKQ